MNGARLIAWVIEVALCGILRGPLLEFVWFLVCRSPRWVTMGLGASRAWIPPEAEYSAWSEGGDVL